jgi:hypothetical protein
MRLVPCRIKAAWQGCVHEAKLGESRNSFLHSALDEEGKLEWGTRFVDELDLKPRVREVVGEQPLFTDLA